MKPKITVLITGVGGGGLGEQLIKALRLSKTVNYIIVGTDVTKFSKGLTETDFQEIIPLAKDPDYIPFLVRVCKKYKIQALLPGSEAELKAISHGRHEFLKEGIFLPINRENVLDICFDKFKTINFLKTHGFYYPQTLQITCLADLNNITFFPVVLKPSKGGSGSANILLAQNEEELSVFGKYLLNIYNEFIAQEYIGTPEHEYTVGVLSSQEGEVLNSIALRRHITSGLGCKIKIQNRTVRTDLGKNLVISSGISQGEIGKYEEVTYVCEKITEKLNASFAINLQCRFHDGKVYLFEINPRFSGTTSLRAMMGYNEPDLLIKKHILGESFQKNFSFQHGTIMRGLSEVIIPE